MLAGRTSVTTHARTHGFCRRCQLNTDALYSCRQAVCQALASAGGGEAAFPQSLQAAPQAEAGRWAGMQVFV